MDNNPDEDAHSFEYCLRLTSVLSRIHLFILDQ